MLKSRIKVQVTERDIERAHKNDSYKCVVSQAVARTVPGARNIETDLQAIRFTLDGERFIFLTPYVVQGYVVAFDAGEPIEPFDFQLREPRRIKRQVRTEAGRAVHNADQRRKRAEKKTAAPKRSNDAAAQKAASHSEAAIEAEAVKAAYKGAPLRKTDEGEFRPPPRVFKKKRRAYGHRLLRINQEVAGE